MIITDAIKCADTEHVVYFLLTAYVETLDYYEPARSVVPPQVKRLPMVGKADVFERLRALRGALLNGRAESRARHIFDEAIDIFTAAYQRLMALKFADWSVQDQLQRFALLNPSSHKPALHATVPGIVNHTAVYGNRE